MHLQQLSQGRFARKWNWKWISPKAQSFPFLEVRGFLHDHKKVYSFTQSCLKICNVMKYSLILSASFSFDSNTFNPKHFGYYWEEKFLSFHVWLFSKQVSRKNINCKFFFKHTQVWFWSQMYYGNTCTVRCLATKFTREGITYKFCSAWSLNWSSVSA